MSRHIEIHENEVAHAARHDEQMEYLVGAEGFMPGIEQGKLQGVDNAARRINESSCQQPQEGGGAQRIQQPAEDQHAYPTHGDINNGGKPFGTGNPAGFHQHARNRNPPDQGQHGVAHVAAQHDQAYRCVGAGDENKNHHMVQLAENTQVPSGEVYGVIGGACAVE